MKDLHGLQDNNGNIPWHHKQMTVVSEQRPYAKLQCVQFSAAFNTNDTWDTLDKALLRGLHVTNSVQIQQ